LIKTLRCDEEGSMRRSSCKVVDPMLPRKASKLQESIKVTVPQTDSGEAEEYSKALERTLVKELGKLTP
jgi:hypothetical protein